MITDNAILDDLRQSWSAVEKLSSDCLFLGATPSGWHKVNRPDELFNLSFVLAFACLDQALVELEAQGAFQCKSRLLGARMYASREAVPWQDFSEVEEGKNKRNDLAHHAKLATKSEALQYIAAIKRELVAWGILESAAGCH